jgi:hypothetical protein
MMMMPPSRFTIAGLLGVIVILSMFFAGLSSGSNDWFKLIYTLVFLTLVYAAIAARYRGPFWYGFAVAGWVYFLIAFGPWIATHAGGEPLHGVNRNIVTSVVLEIVTAIMFRLDVMASGDAMPATDIASMMVLKLREANREGITHCALTILFAVAGGWLARRMAKARGHEPDPR